MKLLDGLYYIADKGKTAHFIVTHEGQDDFYLCRNGELGTRSGVLESGRRPAFIVDHIPSSKRVCINCQRKLESWYPGS